MILATRFPDPAAVLRAVAERRAARRGI
jgi:hypothetical protein